MSQRLLRALLAGVMGAVVGCACLLLLYGWRSRLATEFDVTPPRQLTGVYEAERDDNSGLTFAWTGEVPRIAPAGSGQAGPLDAGAAWAKRAP